METAVTLHPRHVDGTVSQERLSLAISAPTPALRVRRATIQPLAAQQPLATLHLTGDDLEVAIELTADDVEQLAAALASTAAEDEDEDETD